MKKGKTHVLSWPNIFDVPAETVNEYERLGQAATDAWGASRRAFLSSCIRDRKFMDNDAEEEVYLTFHGMIQQPKED